MKTLGLLGGMSWESTIPYYRIINETIRSLIDGSLTGSAGIFELTIPPGSNVPPPHSHSNSEEVLYVLEGVRCYTVGAETRDLTPGAAMHTPKGTAHAFANPFEGPVRTVVANTPGIGVQYFKEVAAVLGAGGPPDRVALAQVMGRYGLVPSILKCCLIRDLKLSSLWRDSRFIPSNRRVCDPSARWYGRGSREASPCPDSAA